ncbi:MAG: dephospho-CoA kinase [Bacteroidetes bacterium]|nr:dephospho-CoA kinase [Bacteroidota bacterium]
MLRIGVTGGIGSGKSTFSTMLESFGAELFNADVEATRIMESNHQVRLDLEELLGPASFLADGTLNRSYISQAAFSDPKVLAKVGKIVHPHVQQAFIKRAEEANREGIPVIVREAAVLPDEATRKGLDVVVSVMADSEIRIQRVKRRSNMTASQVIARIEAQPPDLEYEKAADIVIWNNGTVEELAKEAEHFWQTVHSK